MNKQIRRNSNRSITLSDSACNTVKMPSYYFYAVRFFKYCFFYYYFMQKSVSEKAHAKA